MEKLTRIRLAVLEVVSLVFQLLDLDVKGGPTWLSWVELKLTDFGFSLDIFWTVLLVVHMLGIV